MIPNPKVIFLFLWLLQCGGGNVDVLQKPPIQVALLKEEISIPCKVVFPYMPKYTKFSISYYWINSLLQKTFIYSRVENIAIPSGEENKTAALSYDHRIMPLENTSSTGTYYCEVKWNDIKKMGKGVFVLIRECAPRLLEAALCHRNSRLCVLFVWKLCCVYSPLTPRSVRFQHTQSEITRLKTERQQLAAQLLS
ncbi:hypothetical protein EK904_008198 [Melospiza melodia maxima]|nr:hypothetical protein EK904_008198 [Melospiza melodia maxima]